MIAACCSLADVRCLLCVLWCLLSAVCRRWWLVVRCALFVVCLRFVDCYEVFAGGWSLVLSLCCVLFDLCC